MKGPGRVPAALAVVLVAAAVAAAAAVSASGGGNRTAATACRLSANGQIKHLVYLQFDNTHFRRDRPDVASDLEQMPHLLELPRVQRNAVHERPHDPDLPHRGRDPLLADGPLPGPPGADRLELVRLLPEHRHADLHLVASSTGRPGRRHRRLDAEHDHRHREDDARPVGAVHPCRLRLRRRRHREPRAREQLDRSRRGCRQRVRADLAGGRGAGRPAHDRLRRDRHPLRPDGVEQVRRQHERQKRPAARRAGRLHRLPRAVRDEVRRPGRSPAATRA